MKKIMIFIAMSFAMIGCSERGLNEEPELIINNSYENSILSAKGGGNVSFTFRLGRVSKNCAGWGICELKAFGAQIVGPKVTISLDPKQPPFDDSELNTHKAYYEFETGNELDGLDDTTFYVDENFYVTDDEDNSFKIHQGEYDFDPSIGEFGGYFLKVTKI